MHFFAGVMDGFEGRAGKFKLAAGFKRDIAHAMGITEGDDVVILVNALPAKAITQAFQKGANGTGAIIRHGLQGIGEKGELFVLGANAPVCLWL